MDIVKIGSVLLVVVLVAVLVLFAMGRINPFLFWSLLAMVALFAYIILPKLRKK